MTADTSFWYLISFAIFAGLTARPIISLVRDSLESKQKAIRQELDEAQRIKEEAITLLRDVKQKKMDAQTQTQKILGRADVEIKRIQERTQQEIVTFFESQERQFKERLQAAEQMAILDVNGRIVDMAVDTAREVVERTMDAHLNAQLTEENINNLTKAVTKRLA